MSDNKVIPVVREDDKSTILNPPITDAHKKAVMKAEDVVEFLTMQAERGAINKFEVHQKLIDERLSIQQKNVEEKLTKLGDWATQQLGLLGKRMDEQISKLLKQLEVLLKYIGATEEEKISLAKANEVNLTIRERIVVCEKKLDEIQQEMRNSTEKETEFTAKFRACLVELEKAAEVYCSC